MIKHNENVNNKEKVKYDLYKILRMSVLLNQDNVDSLTLKKFKEASLNIDKLLTVEYEKKLETMFYNTETLEEEEKRLKELVAFVNERIEKRKNLVEDYKNVSTKELTDLEYIEKSGEIDLYEKRLETIRSYLDSSKLIEIDEKELESLEEQLVKEYDLKAANEVKNVKIEEKLYNTFVNILYEMDLYSSIDIDNIDKEIENLQQEIKETNEQKDTFVTAFNNLKESGINGDLELEYASYVENSKKNYYYVKEKEIVLNLYKLIENKESEYSNLYNKREEIKELLQERTLLRTELSIKDKDFLLPLSDLLLEQRQEISSEKENVDNINVLTERIKLKENKLEELRKEVKKPEILSILKEYALIDTYNHDEFLEEEEVDEVVEEESEPAFVLEELLPEEETGEKVYQENEIKEAVTIPTMNLGLSRLKSISVMKRVADMLGVNAKKEELPQEVKEEVVSEPEVVTNNVQEKQSNDYLFWSPVEFADMQKEIDVVAVPNTAPVEPITTQPQEPLTVAMPEVKNENIFVDNNTMFPEPVMPEIVENKELPKEEDKFMWPENNMETFDINGIFPS